MFHFPSTLFRRQCYRLKLPEQKKLASFQIYSRVSAVLRLLRSTIRSIFTLICVLQIGVLSLSVVSPELHFFAFHPDGTTHSGYACADHSDNETPNDEKPRENNQHCPVDVYSHGLILPESNISSNWEYVNYAEFKLSLTKISLPNVSAKLIKQRAPPLS